MKKTIILSAACLALCLTLFGCVNNKKADNDREMQNATGGETYYGNHDLEEVEETAIKETVPMVTVPETTMHTTEQMESIGATEESVSTGHTEITTDATQETEPASTEANETSNNSDLGEYGGAGEEE